MIIELHAIQSFAPANLNRDDQGAPKDCTFGGVPRARVSSQSWKRAIRVAFRDGAGLQTGVRTKRAHREIAKRIQVLAPDLAGDVAEHRAAVLLEAKPLGLSLKREKAEEEVKTGQLVFFRNDDLDTLAALAIEFGEDIDAQTSTLSSEAAARKTAPKPSLPKAAAERAKTAMTSPGHALDVALFGRLVAELPEANVDAACQLAHALGTHRLSTEFDYFTAVDDLKPEDNEGADMIGTIAFNASCFYRYAVIDVEQLASNLGPAADDQHVANALAEFARAFITAAPSGKQTTFAARNLPTAVLAVRRSTGAMNLANAFVAPVEARDAASDGGLAQASVARMLAEFSMLDGMYGARDGSTAAVLLAAGEHGNGAWTHAAHVDDLVAHVADV